MGGRETPRGFPCVVCERLGPNLADTLTARMAPPGANLYATMRGRKVLAGVGWGSMWNMECHPRGVRRVHVCEDATEKAYRLSIREDLQKVRENKAFSLCTVSYSN